MRQTSLSKALRLYIGEPLPHIKASVKSINKVGELRANGYDRKWCNAMYIKEMNTLMSSVRTRRQRVYVGSNIKETVVLYPRSGNWSQDFIDSCDEFLRCCIGDVYKKLNELQADKKV